MNANELSDAEVLRAASGSLSRLPVASPPEVGTIVARGRARRRHRLSAAAGLSVTAAAAVTALSLGLTGAFSSAHVTPTTIKTASFTLVSNANGTDTLTLNPLELLNPSQLQSDLQANGIPAMVTSGSICTSASAPPGFSQVVTFNAPPGGGQPTPQNPASITIDPSAMPTGTELSVGYFQLTSGPATGEQEADMLLVNTNSYTCSNTPPGPDFQVSGYGENDALGLLYGGPGPSGS